MTTTAVDKSRELLLLLESVQAGTAADRKARAKELLHALPLEGSPGTDPNRLKSLESQMREVASVLVLPAGEYAIAFGPLIVYILFNLFLGTLGAIFGVISLAWWPLFYWLFEKRRQRTAATRIHETIELGKRIGYFS